LYHLLEESEAEGTRDIVAWQSNGRSFQIYKPDEFEQKVMKKYFKQTKLKSFTRQVGKP